MMHLAEMLAVLPQTDDGSQTIWEFLQSGGFLMFPIGLCSVFMLAFAIERYAALRPSKIVPPDLDEALQAIEAGKLDQAGTRIAEDRSPAAKVLLAGLRRRGFALGDIEMSMSDQAQKELEKMRHNVRPLTIIAGAAPLMGLLGTVVGIAESFRRVSQAGMGKPEVLAGGIELALTTTIAGLCVAIPSMLIAAHLQSRVRRRMLALDEKVGPAVEWIARADREESHAA